MTRVLLALISCLFISAAFAQQPAKKSAEELRREFAERQAQLKAEMEKQRGQLEPLLRYDIQSLEMAFRIKVIDAFDGCQVYWVDDIAEETKYLGTITNQYGPDSIFSEYSHYGSKYSTDSIWNEYGTYGGKYSAKSPFNPYASNPPVIACRKKIVGRLTTNKYLAGAVDPQWLALVFGE